MDSPKLGCKLLGAQGKQCESPEISKVENQENELSPAQILERMKSDRVTASKPEEDRRRRTIIVEKKNGSFGFTLQSYGIHYKKEQEIEMITYVDYVDYDGAAFRAGMREGDVILSINGHDMEKADHKTLVNFIKNCDSRMRMVVLFEDCVRKVELHMRYIQLQRVLQGKMVELERLCLRERELLQGKWKTHSLPARKKTSAMASDASIPLNDSCDYNYCRPTVSTEDVAHAQQQAHSQLMFAYQYLEPGYYSLQRPCESSSGELLTGWLSQEVSTPGPPQVHSHADGVAHTSRNFDGPARQTGSKIHHQTNGVGAAGGSSGTKGSKNKSHDSHSHPLCSPCVQASQDSSSLEAYDLASPCCDPHCVPSSRRRSRHKEQRNGHGSRSSSKGGSDSKSWKEKDSRNAQNAASQTSSSQIPAHVPQPPQPRVHRYFNFGAGLVSQCSLHSCTSSELSCTAPAGAGGESSGASYTTSLSTDTLYWDPPVEGHLGSRNHSMKSTASKQNCSYQQQHQHHSSAHQSTTFCAYNTAKPAKSWDNLTTKAFGGYGFGYGYLDTSTSKSGNTNKGTNTRTQNPKTCASSHPDDRRENVGLNVNLYGRHYYNCTQPKKLNTSHNA